MSAMGQRDVTLEIKALEKELRSGGSSFRLEVDALSLERGRFYGVTGRSGSGKSTLLDVLALVARPTSVSTFKLSFGEMCIDLNALIAREDDDALSAVRLRHFGYVLQYGGLLPFLTVRENLELPFMLSTGRAERKRIDEMAREFGLSDQLNKRPAQLSGGQRQRVSVIRAVAHTPQIILADEPTASVDEILADKVVGTLKTLAAARGATVVMVSHDLSLVEKFSDSVIAMKPRAISDKRVVTRIEAH